MGENDVTGLTLRQRPLNVLLPPNCASKSRRLHHFPSQPEMHGHIEHNLPMKLEAYSSVEAGRPVD